MSKLTGIWLGIPSEMFSFDISDLSFFLCAGFWIPMAVRSSGVILYTRVVQERLLMRLANRTVLALAASPNSI